MDRRARVSFECPDPGGDEPVELRAEAELEGVTADAVLDGVLGSVPVPR